jgi:hypothetical protein
MFKELVENLKAEALDKAKEAIVKLQDENKAGSFDDYEEQAVEYVLDKMELPLYLKPFKGLIKNCLKNLAKNAVNDVLGKLNDKVNG